MYTFMREKHTNLPEKTYTIFEKKLTDLQKKITDLWEKIQINVKKLTHLRENKCTNLLVKKYTIKRNNITIFTISVKIFEKKK